MTDYEQYQASLSNIILYCPKCGAEYYSDDESECTECGKILIPLTKDDVIEFEPDDN